jgi:hypothetical protein
MTTNVRDKKVVALSIDDNYVWPLLSLCYSLWTNSDEGFIVCIANVNGTLSSMNQELIESVLKTMRLPFRIVEAQIPPDVKTDSRISIAAYGRLWMADNLKEDFIYLDADSLAFEGWQEIFELIPRLKSNPKYLLGASPAKSNKGLNWESEYVNTRLLAFHSTCLIISQKNWKTNTKKFGKNSWYAVARRANELNLLAHDQDTLQFMAQGDFLHVPEAIFELPFRPSTRARIISAGSWTKPWTVREKYIPIRIYQDLFNSRRTNGAYFLDEYNAFKLNEIEFLGFLKSTDLKVFEKVLSLRNMLHTYNPPFLLRVKFHLILFLEKLLSQFHHQKIA